MYAAHASEAFNQRLDAALQNTATVLGRAAGGSLAGLILSGGYGRGEGTVVQGLDGLELAWNDVDLTPVAKPGGKVDLAQTMASITAGRDAAGSGRLQADFKRSLGADLDFGRVLDEADIRRLPPVLLWIETGRGHRIIAGDPELFTRNVSFDPWMAPDQVEASKLLLNRGAGLLMAAVKAAGQATTAHECSDRDFVRRNAAKCGLALGDALLIALEQYETFTAGKLTAFRQAKAAMAIQPATAMLDAAALEEAYRAAIEFKHNPDAFKDDPGSGQLASIAQLWIAVFLAVEGLRNGQVWVGTAEWTSAAYTIEPAEQRGLRKLARNLVHNARLGRPGLRYPRERLFRTLPGLLASIAAGQLPPPDQVDRFIALWSMYN
jgi:hypothetical protein